jgi:AcrR family transcriptional regulator
MPAAVGRRERHKTEKRSRIFNAAEALFAEHGYAAVTTQQIADRADVAIGTLFRYAATKPELLLMVYNEIFSAAITAGTEHAAALSDPLEKVMAQVGPVADAGQQNEENIAVYQRELLFGPPGDQFHAEGLAAVARLELRLAEILAAAGDTSPPTAAAGAARAIFAAVHMHIARSIKDPALVSSVSLRDQVAVIVAGYPVAESVCRSKDVPAPCRTS